MPGVAADEAGGDDDGGRPGGEGGPDAPEGLREVVPDDECAGIGPDGVHAVTGEFPGEDAGGKEFAEGDFLRRRRVFHLPEKLFHFFCGGGPFGPGEEPVHDAQMPLPEGAESAAVSRRAGKQGVRAAADGGTDQYPRYRSSA